MRIIFIFIIILHTLTIKSQTFPSFGSEIDVTISGLSFDAMEPFISPDGNFLFFNNLNDGIDTKLYYASKINDSTFNYIGELNGTNQITPTHLDAVADLDSLGNFFWTSTRNYPTELDNLFHGFFDNGNVTNTGRVRGDFNKNIAGWLVMDHVISYNGQFLYYNNARFDETNCQGPCETEIGIAQKINDSTFNKISNSDIILQNINDANYIYYAPCISSDGLELYYTRYPRDTITQATLFEICVAVRNTPTGNFSSPTVLFSDLISDLIEAPTLTTNKQIIYYHKKTVSSYKIVMRYREASLNTIRLNNSTLPYIIYPNPSNNKINIKIRGNYYNLKLSIFTLCGERIITTSNQAFIDISTIPAGIYLFKIDIDGKIETRKIIKTE